jgi:hypothetical protein
VVWGIDARHGVHVSQVVIYTRPGIDLHEALCDAYLAHAGWVTIDEVFHEILTMSDGWGPGARYTRWLLRQAPAGRA